MRIRQYVYLALRSEVLTAAEMAERVGLAADRSQVRGSEVAGPKPRPRCHSWQIVCEEPGLTVDEQIERVVERVGAHRQAIRDLVSEEPVTVTLQAVRKLGAWLGDDEGEEEDLSAGVDGVEKLPGQHQLLGWHLSTEAMAFLLEIGAELDVDEYG